MSEAKVVVLGEADFDAVIRAGGPVFVDFWAPWCPPCRLIAPIVEELAPLYAGKAVLAKVNVDESQALAQRLGVGSIPTLMMFKGGRLADRMVGAAPRRVIEAFIDRNL